MDEENIPKLRQNLDEIKVPEHTDVEIILRSPIDIKLLGMEKQHMYTFPIERDETIETSTEYLRFGSRYRVKYYLDEHHIESPTRFLTDLQHLFDTKTKDI